MDFFLNRICWSKVTAVLGVMVAASIAVASYRTVSAKGEETAPRFGQPVVKSSPLVAKLYKLVNGKKVYTNVCDTHGNHVLYVDASGFDPGGDYRTVAWYPDRTNFHGGAYTALLNNGVGHADAHGHLPAWNWDCRVGAGGQPDPASSPGDPYVVEIVEKDSPRMVRLTIQTK